MLRNFGTVRLSFMKLASEIAQDLKKKGMKAHGTKFFPQNYHAKRRGGGGGRIPPPAFLGLSMLCGPRP